MTDDEAAFLARIREEPDADLPRLVFADYLEEQGHETRAHFIRAQIELASLTEDSPRRRELAWHCRQHIEGNSEADIPEPLRPLRTRFARGLIEYAELWRASLFTVTDALTLAPLRRMWLYGQEEVLDAVTWLPRDSHLRTLDLTGTDLSSSGPNVSSFLLTFPHLKEMVLTGCELDDEAAECMCFSSGLAKLDRIHLGGNPFTADGRQRLRDHFGDRVTFDCEGDPERLFTFDAIDSDLTVGFGKNLTQHLVLAGYTGVRIAEFDHAGNVLRLVEREHLETRILEPIREALLHELGHTPATIRVKRFQFPNGTGITPFVPHWMESLDDPTGDERDSDRRWFTDWLDNGSFRWQWGQTDDWWLNSEGQVTDT